MTACPICSRDTPEASTVKAEDGTTHQFCHPTTDAGPRPLSCLEILGFVAVENMPNGRQPMQAIPPIKAARARRWIGDHRRA